MAPVAAAVLPHPPLLVPELAGAAAPELTPLRAACQEALATVAAAADLTIVIGDGPVWGVPAPAAPGSFHPYGAEVSVELPALVDLELPGVPPPAELTGLPLSLAVAAHLLDGLDPPPRQLFAASVPRSLGPRAAAAIGHALGATAPFGLVAMADLSACRTEQAPGALRPEAAGFDARVGDAFRTGTPHHLLTLDPAQCADLLVAGRVALQVLVGAFEGTPPEDGNPPEAGKGAPPGPAPAEDRTTLRGRAPDEGKGDLPGQPPGKGNGGLRGRVLYEDAPYGVGYLVAVLTGPER